MHPLATYEAALELGKIGMGASWIARELAVPRATIAGWLRRGRQGRRPEPPHPLPEASYSYLLGLYLGDGHIARGGHGQHVLSIACDNSYQGIIDAAATAIQTVRPGASVPRQVRPDHGRTHVICVSRWWPVLFPQHGKGRKHTRPIVLAVGSGESRRPSPRP